MFDTQTLDDNKLVLDDPSQDYIEALKMAGLTDQPDGTVLSAVVEGHTIKIWNPAI